MSINSVRNDTVFHIAASRYAHQASCACFARQSLALASKPMHIAKRNARIAPANALADVGYSTSILLQQRLFNAQRGACFQRGLRRSVKPTAASSSGSDASSDFWPVAKLKQLISLLPSYECVKVIDRLTRLLWRHLWAILFVYSVKDILQFLLHRVTHRLTNHAAEAIFKYPVLQEAVNPWWLVMDPQFLQQYSGYQLVMGIFFAIALPLNLLLTASAGAAATLLTIAPSTAPSTIPTPTGSPSSTPGEQAAASSSPLTGPEDAPPSPSSPTAAADDASSSPSSPTAGAGNVSTAAEEDTGSSGVATITASSSSSSSGGGSGGSSGSSSSGVVNGSEGGDGSGNESASGSGTARAGETGQGETSPSAAAAAATSGSSSSTSASTSSSTVASTSTSSQSQRKGFRSGIKAGWQEAVATLPQVKGMLGRVWVTEMVVSAIGLLLQGGMMLVLPIPWLLPIYMQAHLAGVTSVLEGQRGLAAIKRSGELINGTRRVVFWPLLLLILASRFSDWLKVSAFAMMPQRLWSDAVEVPLALLVGTHLLPLIIIRLQDLLPMAMYLYLKFKSQEQEQPDAAKGGDAAVAATPAPA